MIAMPREFCDLPAMRPPQQADGSLQNWRIESHWLSPALDGKRVAIASGAYTDGASIPRVAWRAIGHPFMWPVLGPALCHDALYAAELVRNHSTADWMFLRWLEQAGVNWAKRNLVWSAVRCFGGIVWGKHTPESVRHARRYFRLIGADEDPRWDRSEMEPGDEL